MVRAAWQLALPSCPETAGEARREQAPLSCLCLQPACLWGVSRKRCPHVRGAAARLCASKRQQRAVVKPFLLASASSWKALLLSSH